MAMVMCAYGDCHEELESKGPFKLTVSISYSGRLDDRQSFCCYEHAILWLQRRDELLNARKWRAPVETLGAAVMLGMMLSLLMGA